jgi:hypothetical protein
VDAFLPLLKNLLTGLTPEEVQQDSFLNYHAIGFNYLCLLRSPRLTVKMYFATKDLRPCGNEDYVVNPHDHSYNFHTLCLTGSVDNINFHVTDTPAGYYHAFRFDSDQKRFAREGRATLHGHRDTYKAGDSYYLEHDVVHTISAQPGTSLLLIQYEKQLKGPTRFFSYEDNPPSLKNLYVRPSLTESKDLVQLAHASAYGIFWRAGLVGR